ncbi:MAG TPA: dihydroxyacetone kinase subunit DhaL [Polyangiaceae bacterium]|nr:dihydroxyacetone kinase subunit DhaL [Polyangiaceae bacterium]
MSTHSDGSSTPALGADTPTSTQRVVEQVVRTIAQTAVDNEARFSALDAVVGDGDFGFSLARGFERVLAELDQLDRRTPGAFLKRVAVIITSRCGGTSGPIWGTAFLRAGAALGERVELGGADVVAMLRAAFTGIAQRGGAALGDKTLLDALGPFIDRFEAELGGGSPRELLDALERAAEAAHAAAEATASLVAKRGRAAYTGERSRGSVDPGAIALAVIAKEIVASLRASAA